MAQNLEALRQAAVIYPIFAVLFTVPYLLYCYRKYGSVLSLRIVIVYSFALYLLCVYCLVILPLPSAEKARTLSGRKQQWIPFWFVRNMLGEAKPVWNQPKSWLRMLNTNAFLTTALNVLMTLPFGIYLRYYFRCSLKKTLIASFLLSFGGLSILAQSRAAAADAGLEGRQLPGCKMLQGAIAAALALLLAPLAQAGRWCAPTLGASTMMETAGPVMLLLSSVLLLYFRKKYHSILREGRV